MLTRVMYLCIMVAAIACVKYEGDEFLPQEEYDQQDTVSHIYIGINKGWDFRTNHPRQLYYVSLQKYHYDSIYAWDPYSQTYITWSGSPGKGWFYDSVTNGRYQVRFLTDQLLDTSVAPYKDYGTYMIFDVNKKLIGQPVAEIIDTIGDRRLATLKLHRFNNFTVSMDTARMSYSPPGRPSAKEMAKTFNSLLYHMKDYYRFKKPKWAQP